MVEEYSDPSNDFGFPQAKSSVKIIKNTKGINIEIKVVAGEEHIVPKLRAIALNNYNKLLEELRGYK